jgi:tetratricopeptide (TPR) repeat protein
MAQTAGNVPLRLDEIADPLPVTSPEDQTDRPGGIRSSRRFGLLPEYSGSVTECPRKLELPAHPPVDSEVHHIHKRAVAFHRLGDHTRARALYGQVLKGRPCRKLLFQALNNLALLYEDMDDLGRAEDTYTQALQLSSCGVQQPFVGSSCKQQLCEGCAQSWRVDGVARDVHTLRNYGRFLHTQRRRFAEAEVLFRLAFSAGLAWRQDDDAERMGDDEEEGWVQRECGDTLNDLRVPAVKRWRIGDKTQTRDAQTLALYGALIFDGLLTEHKMTLNSAALPAAQTQAAVSMTCWTDRQCELLRACIRVSSRAAQHDHHLAQARRLLAKAWALVAEGVSKRVLPPHERSWEETWARSKEWTWEGGDEDSCGGSGGGALFPLVRAVKSSSKHVSSRHAISILEMLGGVNGEDVRGAGGAGGCGTGRVAAEGAARGRQGGTDGVDVQIDVAGALALFYERFGGDMPRPSVEEVSSVSTRATLHPTP